MTFDVDYAEFYSFTIIISTFSGQMKYGQDSCYIEYLSIMGRGLAKYCDLSEKTAQNF